MIYREHIFILRKSIDDPKIAYTLRRLINVYSFTIVYYRDVYKNNATTPGRVTISVKNKNLET